MTEKKNRSESFSPFGSKDLIFFAAVSVFILSQLFQFPLMPIYFDGDHLISVSNAMRMMDGETIYKDFFHLTPPGAELVYSFLFSVFGVKIWILNAVIATLGIALAWHLWYLSRRFFSGWMVYLPAIVYFVIGYRPFLIDGTYRLFSVILVLGAIAAVIDRRSQRNLIIAGILCGLASLFVQTRGGLGIVGISIFLLWENYNSEFNLKKLVNSGLWLCAPFLVVIVLTQFYFVIQAGFDNYYFSIVTFLRDHYPNDPLAKNSAYFDEIPDLASYMQDQGFLRGVSRFIRVAGPPLFFYAIVPLVYICFLAFRWRSKSYEGGSATDKGLLLLSITGVILAAGVSAPTAGRYSHVGIPAVITLVWLIAQIRNTTGLRLASFLFLSIASCLYIVQRQIIAKSVLDMPAGSAAFLTEDIVEKYRWIGEKTRPGELLYEARHPNFYFPFHLKNPTPLYLVRDSDYTPTFQVDAVVWALKEQPPNIIVWHRNWSQPEESRAEGDHLEKLWQFISQNYHLTAEFKESDDRGQMEMWERN